MARDLSPHPIILGGLIKSLVSEPLPPHFCPKVNGDYLDTVQKLRKKQGNPGTFPAFSANVPQQYPQLVVLSA
jgi:hypothetical protein